MGDIDLPGPPQNMCTRDHEAAFAHFAAIDERSCIARHEDKDFGCVAETVIANGDPGDQVGGNVIEKNQPKCDPAEQIEPQIAFGNGHRCKHRSDLSCGKQYVKSVTGPLGEIVLRLRKSRESRARETSVPVPTFVSLCSTRFNV